MCAVCVDFGCLGVPPPKDIRSEFPVSHVSQGKPASYAEERARFKTRLVRWGPAPQDYELATPPPDAREITYTSGTLTLRAWVSVSSTSNAASAVLFLHGGFAFAKDDWDMVQPYRDAGFVVLMPMLRGENGAPGSYSLFFHEVDDVLAAADALGATPNVRADRLFIAGHSVGGTLTMLAAMYSGKFRAAASFGGSPDQLQWVAGDPELVPFDFADLNEFRIRSPLAFPTSFQCPTRLYHGTAETYFEENTAELARLARQAGLDVRAVPVAGDHGSHVPEAINKSIEFFRQNE